MTRHRRWRQRARHLTDRLLDRLTGMRTTASPADPPREHGNDVRYEGSRWLALRHTLTRSTVTPADVFLDLGCGKGRVLYLASFYRFRRIIGVEALPQLADQARANVTHARGPRRLRTADIVTARAEHYPIPADVTVVYLFNPFRGEVFDTVCRNLTESVHRHPRALRLIYANPKHEDQLLAAGFTIARRTRHATVYIWSTTSSGANTARS